MVKKILFVSFISYCYYIAIMIILSYFLANNGIDFTNYSISVFLVQTFVFVGLPVMLLSSILLLVFNSIISWLLNRKKRYINQLYFLTGFGIILLLIAAYFYFDFITGHLNNDKYRVRIIKEYFSYSLLGVILLLVNRKFVFNNFKNTISR